MARKLGKMVLESRLKALSGRLLRILKIKNSYAEVFLLSGAGMRRLGRKYLKKKKGYAPDVLSFVEPKGFPHPEKRTKFLGEIYINKDLTRRDPRRAAFLLVHGLLHLLGYTHERKSDILRMEKAEKRLIKKLGQFGI